MKDTNIIIAVAKLDEFTQLDNMPNPMLALEVCEYEAACCYTRASEFEYLTSREAIIPVIGKVCDTKELKEEFILCLTLELDDTEHFSLLDVFSAITKTTAKQLCIALLKAAGKWEE